MSELVTGRLIDTVVGDPSNGMYQGRVMAALSNIGRGQYLGRHTAPARDLLEELRAERRTAPPIELYHVPAAAVVTEKRDLTPAEGAWLLQLGDPAEATDEDFKILSTLAGTVRTPAERLMVRQAFEPVQARHAARAQASHLEREISLMPVAPNPTKREGWERWRRMIGEEIREDMPALTQADAEGVAERRVMERWQKEGVEASQQRARKCEELGGLLREHGLKSEWFPEAHRWGTASDPGYAPPVVAAA